MRPGDAAAQAAAADSSATAWPLGRALLRPLPPVLLEFLRCVTAYDQSCGSVLTCTGAVVPRLYWADCE